MEEELTTEEWMKRLTKRLDSPTREEQVARYLKSGEVYDPDKGCYVYEY